MNLAQSITRALRGDWHGSYGTVPAPGRSPKNRSVSITAHSSDPSDVIVYSHRGDDALAIKDEWRRRGLLPPRSGRSGSRATLSVSSAQEAAMVASDVEEVRRSQAKARGLWWRSLPITGTPAERYLREVRKIDGELPETLRFLPARGGYAPSMIAPFGLPEEPEPGRLRIEPSAIGGVHLTHLRADGSGKADLEPNKIMVGRGHSLPIVLAPANEGLGLAITEGIEDALSIHLLWDVGVWAAGSAGRMPGLSEHVPGYVDVVTVFIDADRAGERGGGELVQRLRARDFEVIAMPLAEVRHGQA